MTSDEKDEVREIFKNTPLTDIHMQQIESKFVTRSSCNATVNSIRKKLLQDYTDLAVIKFQNKMILAIISFIGVTIGGYIISRLMGAI